jgi:bifunctional non-homologous end joining protein LigD
MPVPVWVDPQLATLTQDRFSDPSWIYERKLDGERCLAFHDGSVRLLTRNQHDVTGTFPEVAAAIGAVGDGCVLDGEIVAFEGDETRFERLQQRLGVAAPDARLIHDYPVVYYVFDVMFARGEDIRPRPELERKGVLRELLTDSDSVRYTEHRTGDGVAFWRQACSDGWEGLIAKNADAPYAGGRTRNWLKFKCLAGQEMVIGGFTDPQRSRQGFGALLLGYYDGDGALTYAGKVGTGFDNQTLLRLRADLDAIARDTSPFQVGVPPRTGVHWVEPTLVAQIEFAEWTRDGLLRQPRFQGLRDDKTAAEVVRERPTSAV